jgi:hypothetical protein
LIGARSKRLVVAGCKSAQVAGSLKGRAVAAPKPFGGRGALEHRKFFLAVQYFLK